MTNYEKYGEMAAKEFLKGRDISSARYSPSEFLTGFLIWLNQQCTPEPTAEQRKIVEAAVALGFPWVTRDRCGELHFHMEKPVRYMNGYWAGGQSFCCPRNIDGLPIRWEDDKPTYIPDLLEGK